MLDVSGTAVGNAGMEALARNASGGSLPLMLFVSQTALGDDAMEFVSRIHRPKHLDLSETHVTDAGLVRLAAIPEMNITSQILDRTQISDEGLRALLPQDHPSNFDLLSLSGTRVTWEYIETWNSAPEELRLAGLDIRDRAANWFAEHGGHCRELDLSDTRLTDLVSRPLKSVPDCGGYASRTARSRKPPPFTLCKALPRPRPPFRPDSAAPTCRPDSEVSRNRLAGAVKARRESAGHCWSGDSVRLYFP